VIGAVYTLAGGHSQRLRTDYDGAARTQSRVSVSRARVCISQAGEVPLNRLLPGLVPLAPDKSARGTEFGFQLSTKRSIRPNVFFISFASGKVAMGIKPRLPAKRKVLEANPDAAVKFLKLSGGPWLLIAIEPDVGPQETVTATTMNEVRRFIGRHDGVAHELEAVG
jgi:hypothetical protein